MFLGISIEVSVPDFILEDGVDVGTDDFDGFLDDQGIRLLYLITDLLNNPLSDQVFVTLTHLVGSLHVEDQVARSRLQPVDQLLDVSHEDSLSNVFGEILLNLIQGLFRVQ